jgi:hypothetical protein
MRSNGYASICFGLLTIASVIWISQFLREVVYRRLFVEYTDLNDLSSTWTKSNSSGWSWILLLLLVSIYVAIRSKGEIKQSLVLVLRRSALAFVPFVVIGISLLLIAIWAGYSFTDLIFFIFPTDIIADHQAVGRIGARARGVLPVFLIVTAATLYCYLSDRMRADKATLSLFLLLLVPATFARFFPTYNMLYLGVFPVAVFLAVRSRTEPGIASAPQHDDDSFLYYLLFGIELSSLHKNTTRRPQSWPFNKARNRASIRDLRGKRRI